MVESQAVYEAVPLPAELDDLLRDSEELRRRLAVKRDLGIGRSLRYARERAGLTQSAVAKTMGIEQSRVSQIEGAEGHAISLGVLARYSKAVGCRVRIDLLDAESRKVVTRVLVSAEGDDAQENAPVPVQFIYESRGAEDALGQWRSVVTVTPGAREADYGQAG